MTFGKPQPFPDGQNYFCPYQITGTDHDDANCNAGGIDEVQALMLALKQANSVLAATAEYKAGKLVWVGSSAPGDIGLPQIAHSLSA